MKRQGLILSYTNYIKPKLLFKISKTNNLLRDYICYRIMLQKLKQGVIIQKMYRNMIQELLPKQTVIGIKGIKSNSLQKQWEMWFLILIYIWNYKLKLKTKKVFLNAKEKTDNC